MTARSLWGGARANGRELQSGVVLRQKIRQRRPPVTVVVTCPSCETALAETTPFVEVRCPSCHVWVSSLSRKGTTTR